MSESKFTKGPWEVEVVAINPLGLGLINEYQIVAQRPGANENFGDVIATVHTVDELDGDRANAYLIASSWELYEALKEARDCVAECANYESSDKRRPDRMQSTLKILTMVDMAIGKAEGRS